MADINTASINVRGINDNVKRNKVYNWLLKKNVSIGFIQETFCTPSFVPFFNVGWKGKIFHATTNSSHSRGVSIIFNPKLEFTLTSQHRGDDGRKLLLN